MKKDILRIFEGKNYLLNNYFLINISYSLHLIREKA